MKKTIVIFTMMLTMVHGTLAQNKKEMQATIGQLTEKVDQQAKTIETLQSQLTTANSTIATLQQTNAMLMQEMQNSSTARKGALSTAKDSIADMLARYSACEKWEELLPFVMEPERVKPLMKEYHEKNALRLNEKDPEDFKTLLKVKDNLFTAPYSHYDVFNDTYVVKTADGYKIDWEASVVYNPVELKELESMPGKSIVWRGKVHLDSSYDNNWFNYYSGFSGGLIKLYSRKGTKADKDLFAIMKDGKERSFILKLKRVRLDDGDEINEIVEVISRSLSQY